MTMETEATIAEHLLVLEDLARQQGKTRLADVFRRMSFDVDSINAASVDDAMRVLRADYYGSVRSTAHDLIQAMQDGEIEDTGALHDRVREVVDSSGWIIHKARLVLVLSDNALSDNAAARLVDMSVPDAFEQLAYWALERDLYEALESEDVDINDVEGWLEEQEDEDDEDED